jgi:hypothetical protein
LSRGAKKEEGRNIGLIGRPRLLAPEYEAELVRQIEEAEAKLKYPSSLGLQHHKPLLDGCFSLSGNSMEIRWRESRFKKGKQRQREKQKTKP